MPVWHDATKQWVKDGKLVLLGVTEEQHPERCRLFAQWKGFDWPILHDPMNVLELTAVPVVTAIDEQGVVRAVRPDPKTFEAEFLDKKFADDAKEVGPSLTPVHPPKFDGLKPKDTEKSAEAWRKYGDALVLWGGEGKLTAGIEAYRTATKLDPKDGRAWFRLGVQLRRRSEAKVAEADDFRDAVAAWDAALALDPNQYIWRRRIQQYGPRLDKPYPFYDWVPEAEKAIRDRGDTPVSLPVRPGGAEIAKPLKAFLAAAEAKNPDPDGKVNRAEKGSVRATAVVVPAGVKAGQTARIHLKLSLDPKAKLHWNNEAEPLRVWLEPPDGWAVSERLISADVPKTAVSAEDRTVEFEVQVPKWATGEVTLTGFALFHVCDDAGGTCRFVRLDVAIPMAVSK